MGTFKSHALLGAIAGFMLLSGSVVQAAGIQGAIYTSLEGGGAVNANLYDAKEDVYLNGGPSNYPQCNGGELEDGDYFFQVTNPSGSVLLSSDDIQERKFRAAGGAIDEYLGGTHHVSPNTDGCGGISIQLYPYDDTPNNGGVYKVWITRVAEYAPGTANHGFSGATKTDNFRIREQSTEDPFGTLNAYKFYDANANGIWDGDELPIEGWLIRLSPLTGDQETEDTKSTDTDGLASWTGLTPNGEAFTYTVAEGTPQEANWFHSTPNPVEGLDVFAGETTLVEFGNYCEIGSGGKTLGFWSNRNGERALVGDWIAILTALNLRNADGSHFTPTNVANFRTWLLEGSATNMSYMLSVQLAAMAMNVASGFVDADAFYAPYGGTIAELMAQADEALGEEGYAVAGNADRAYQEALKDHLDALNNGAGVVSATPCAFSFGEDPFGDAEDEGGGEQ